MEIYEMLFNAEGHNVFKVSLVEKPAVGAISVKMNSDEVPVFHADEEKRIMYAVVMSPNKKIYRNNIFQTEENKTEGYVFASAETIQQFQQNYMKNHGNVKTNLQHGEDVDGVYPIEMWTVLDKEYDKATKMGMEVENGDWIQGWKYDNEQAWQDAKSGKINGASIEGLIVHKKANINKVNMNRNSILKDVQEHFVKLAGELKSLTVGDATYKAMDWIEGEIVVGENGEPLMNESFVYDGNTYSTDGMGAITSVVVVEEEPEKESAEEVEEVPAEEADNSELDSLKEENSKLKEELAKAEAEKVKAETALTTMANEKPAAAPIANVPVIMNKVEMQKHFESMSPLERFRASKQN